MSSSSYVILYKDYAGSESFTIEVNKYTPNSVHSISGTFQDKASTVRYNLPEGCVVTLYQNVTTTQPPNLYNAGRVCDLIGDGQEHEVYLPDYGMNDCVSAFVWRNVNPAQGYVMLYEAASYTGARTALFPEEWPSGEAQSIVGWAANDKVSSIRWVNLMDTVNMTLYEHIDSGMPFNNIWGGTGAIADLKAVGFNDTASSFKFTRYKPVKEIIEEVVIRDVVPVNQVGTTLESEGNVNAEEHEATLTFNFESSITETTSVTITETDSVGGALELGYTWDPPASSHGGTLTLMLQYNYTHEQSNTATSERSLKLNVSEGYICPARSQWHYEWIGVTGKADGSFETTATRWYEVPLAGTVPDGTLYKRTETLRGTFKGVLFVKTYSEFNTTPLA